MKKVEFKKLKVGKFFKHKNILKIKSSYGEGVSLKTGRVSYHKFNNPLVQPVTVKITVKG